MIPDQSQTGVTSPADSYRVVQVSSTDPGQALSGRLQLTRCTRPDLQPGQVRIGMLAMCINPADLLQLDGRYGVQPVLPYVPGHEGVAVVLELGPDVTGLAVGTRVLPMTAGGFWADERVVSSRQLVPIPDKVDVLQCAMLTANPATAWVLLRHMRLMERGAWLIQNAANSAVGQCVRQLAEPLGLRVVNVVRRAQAVPADSSDAAVWVVDDGDSPQDLRSKVNALTGGARIDLALDAIGGPASAALAHCLADGGLQVVYGLLSGQRSEWEAHDLVFRGVEVRGFWLASWFARPDNRQKARSLYPELVGLVVSGQLHIDVEAVYPLADVVQAVQHAARPGRQGKILLRGSSLETGEEHHHG